MEKRINTDVISSWRKLICDILSSFPDHEKFKEAIEKRKDFIANDDILYHHRSFNNSKLEDLKNKTNHAVLYMGFLGFDRYLAHLQLSDYEYFGNKARQFDSDDVIITVNYNYLMNTVRELFGDDIGIDNITGITGDFADIISRLKAVIISECSSILV